MDNPLVTHSVADLWGVDEGVQIYGSAGKWRYNLAVQNGGHKALHDYNADKSITARLTYAASPHLRLSASLMRTGRLSASGDVFSELWIANGFFRALGPAASTTSFSANLAELDAHWQWATGHVHGTAGTIGYQDDSRPAANQRHLTYYSLEGVQYLSSGWYGAARYSGITVPSGYPLVGLGNFSQYMFLAAPTRELQRLSVGGGYRFAPPLIWKFDYTWEFGQLVSGSSRTHLTDMLSTEIGMKF